MDNYAECKKETFPLSLNFLIIKGARFRVNLRLEENVMKRRAVLIVNDC